VAPEEHSRIVEAAGGFDNAYTNDDVTVYWETFPSNYLERIVCWRRTAWKPDRRRCELQVERKSLKRNAVWASRILPTVR